MKPWYSAIGATLLALTLLLGSGLAASAQALPDPAPDTPATQPFSQGWATQVSAGGAHTCAVTLTGGVQCWGRNTVGQLGDGTTRARGAPVAVLGLSERVGMVSVGGGHTCAVTASGGVQCWGANGNGQLGDGTTSARLAPVAVVGLSHGVQALSAGSNHTCALLDNGGVQCWGANGYGQLGDGTTTAHLTPGDVVGLTSGVHALAAGYDHTCAIEGAGGAKCWGGGSSGELGNGVFVERQRTPVDVVDLAPGVTALSAGGAHTCAVTASGGAKCWGRNMDGQVGVDSPASVIWRPTDGGGLPIGVTGIAAGYLHTCATLASGEAKCWGWNGDAQLGDGTTSTRRSPVAVWRLDYDCTSVTEIPPSECQALVTFSQGYQRAALAGAHGLAAHATPCSWRAWRVRVATSAGSTCRLTTWSTRCGRAG